VKIMLVDYCSLWDALFRTGLRNDHGDAEPSLLEQWRADGWEGVEQLATLFRNSHPDLQIWRDNVRNKVAAHVDPDINIWEADLQHWPMTRTQLVDEVYRVLNAINSAARDEIRARVFFMPPQHLQGTSGLAAQEGRHWDES
jgi:hypothetical protein